MGKEKEKRIKRNTNYQSLPSVVLPTTPNVARSRVVISWGASPQVALLALQFLIQLCSLPHTEGRASFLKREEKLTFKIKPEVTRQSTKTKSVRDHDSGLHRYLAIFQEKTWSDQERRHSSHFGRSGSPSFFYTRLIRRSDHGGDGAYTSGHRARGGVHPGQIASPSQGHTETNETNSHTRSYGQF